MKKIKVAVLCGGFSSEREVSLKTGKAVYETLKKSKKYLPALFDITRKNCYIKLLQIKKAKFDIVFIALHGKFGEDGKLQLLLDCLNLKYTGCNALASAIAMNKILTKELLIRNDIPTPPFTVVKKETKLISKFFEHINKKISFPVIVKPAKEGSAIGVYLSNNKKELVSAIQLGFKYDNTLLIEKYIEGSELSVPILGNKVLPIIEIKPNLGKFYNYESKYKTGGSMHIIPAQISKELYHKVSELTIKSFKCIGAEVMARIDFRVDQKNNPYVLEINTIPGMTATSLFPESAKKSGISFDKLLDKIISLSFKKYT